MGDFAKDHLVSVKDSMYQSLKEYSIQKYGKQNYVTKVLQDILENFFKKLT